MPKMKPGLDVQKMQLPVVQLEKPYFGEDQCSHCTALCCRYITVEIEAPEDEHELDNIRWYLIHQGISLLVEEDQWMLKIESVCRFLGADHRCTIYETRPQACRDYKTDDCDYMTWKGGYPAAYREFTDFQRLKEFTEDWWWEKHPPEDND